ncbi:unnamed protein product [Caenorhabditis sp. 36 PRJEB53466]|nr:unnamed protein product [Caenorhabditis sp. 36 PRJEB53466]
MAHLASGEAREISGAHGRLVGVFQEKWHSERTSISSAINMFDGLLGVIIRIDVQLARASVRIHRNVNLRRPDVDVHSTRHDVMKRFRNQVNSACQLADLTDIGPAANADERAALDTIKLELTQLLDEISPSHSPGSATESD